LLANQDQIKEIFELFDTDGCGELDETEARSAMLALGFQQASSGEREGEGWQAARLMNKHKFE
jgi:Ca2+-binding EF-hand superfamily protein